MKSNIRIAVTSPSFSANPLLCRRLSEYFSEVKLNDTGRMLKAECLPSFLDGAVGAITGLDVIDRALLDRVPTVRVIAKYGVGLDMIDIDALKSYGISIGWTAGINRRSVSELTLCFMLGLTRDVFISSFKLKNGQWDKRGGYQLTGKTIGIIGCGHIGKDVAKLIKAFDCHILVNDIVDMNDFCSEIDAKQVSLERLLKDSDVVTLHVPLDDSTFHLINKGTIALMKKGAYLINTSRGAVVDENGLKEALISKHLGGAALDVFMKEPPTDLEFLSLPNLVISPHIGGNAREAMESMGMAAINYLKEFFKL